MYGGDGHAHLAAVDSGEVRFEPTDTVREYDQERRERMTRGRVHTLAGAVLLALAPLMTGCTGAAAAVDEEWRRRAGRGAPTAELVVGGFGDEGVVTAGADLAELRRRSVAIRRRADDHAEQRVVRRGEERDRLIAQRRRSLHRFF